MPKPGYYYYENKRALSGLIFLIVFLAAAFALKSADLSFAEGTDLALEYRYPLAFGISVAFVILFLIVRRARISFLEPAPCRYRTREEFISALEKYSKRQGYKHGWVHFRGRELWPLS